MSFLEARQAVIKYLLSKLKRTINKYKSRNSCLNQNDVKLLSTLLEGHLLKSHLTASLQTRHPAVSVTTYKRDIKQRTRVTDVKCRGENFKHCRIRQSDSTHVNVNMLVAYRSRPSCSADERGKASTITGALRSRMGPWARLCCISFCLSR